MSQQKKRNHATVACINCRGKRKKCDVRSGENKCTRCIERNLSCIFIPGGKRGPRPAADAFITNPSSFIHDEQMSNNNQNNTIVTNINTYMTAETTATTEIFNNTQTSSNFHDQNITSFSTNDLNGSFYHETPHLYINPCDEATESPQECKYVLICLNHFRQSDCVHSFVSRLADQAKE
ncbi:35080_t:CDS:1 [Racocetra persica]|uniref:35080_t:CDS:1 n=1 Tax=Racocetra persica TaxID=160502 RepID=A0ACA9MZM9_9GLOM|nr:35080_t:CDS:1 [Racocetra persica]